MSERKPGTRDEDRRERLALALRENLKKRKAQARAKQAPKEAGDKATKASKR